MNALSRHGGERSRDPSANEREKILGFYHQKLDEGASERMAWTMVANVLLNLDDRSITASSRFFTTIGIPSVLSPPFAFGIFTVRTGICCFKKTAPFLRTATAAPGIRRALIALSIKVPISAWIESAAIFWAGWAQPVSNEA
jgi:hypothetical protein